MIDEENIKVVLFSLDDVAEGLEDFILKASSAAELEFMILVFENDKHQLPSEYQNLIFSEAGAAQEREVFVNE